MKSNVLIVALLATFSLMSCSPKDGPEDFPGGNFPNSLVNNNTVRIDTITPPNNPLGNLGTNPVTDTLAYYGYLDLAKMDDGTRYCVLVGLRDTVMHKYECSVPTGNIYILLNQTGQRFRYDDPIVSNLTVGEPLYIYGVLRQEKLKDGNYIWYLKMCGADKIDEPRHVEYPIECSYH